MGRIVIVVVILHVSQFVFSQVSFDNRIIVDQSTMANQVESVFTADLDGDGDLDLISASREDDKIAWYENIDGNGTYGAQMVLSTEADNAVAVHAGDVDGDGDMDVVAASFDDEKVVWFENTDGLGLFSAEIIISQDANVIFGALSVYAVDMDDDDDLDVLIFEGIANVGAAFVNFEDGGDVDVSFTEGAVGTAGRDDGKASCGEFLGNGNDSGFVAIVD